MGEGAAEQDDKTGKAQGQREGQRRLAQWVRDYSRLPGIPDEFLGPGGAPRAVWSRFFDAFGALAPDEIERRFGMADRHLREAGVTYRAPGDSADRPWSISHLPLLIDEADWKQLSAGITQRAELLELVLRDIYGEGRLVAEGALPAAAIAGSPEYLRPVCGVPPPGGRYLSLYAADVGRGPDGRWWVLGDRTQAPSGAGYALENRLVLSRAFSDLYKSMNVPRVAPFFEAFRDSLRARADRDEPRIGVLTPGSFSETYFEHATLARYLGFLLVEGDDLAVSDNRIHIRTVAGLKRLDVLLRRVDSNSLDPLELDASSHLGVAGLIDVLRKDGVVVANMPGSGVLEARALLGFLPALSRRLLGQELKMPHIATWWCGQRNARDEVLSRLDEVAIEGAYRRGVPGFDSNGPVLASELDAAGRQRLVDAISARGMDYVGQEMVRLSTMPVWEQGQLTPRPFVLRVFAAATADGWAIMPGGFCRIAEQADARAVSMGDGARAADVWVVSDKKVSIATLLPATVQGADPPHRRCAAEPRRGQSVLARPLSRTRRGNAAAGARAGLAERAQQGHRGLAAIGRPHPAPAGGVGRDLAGLAHCAGAHRRRSAAEPGAVRLGAVAGARGAAHGDIPARAAVARRLAGHHRDGRSAGLRGRGRRRCAERGRADLAGACEPCGTGAGEHEPRRRLALPRYRPPHRARHQHHALRAPVRL
ncbi:putative circularly permuted ATP-grasp superfamily protein [Bradyrhizobium sp. S3.14.4]